MWRYAAIAAVLAVLASQAPALIQSSLDAEPPAEPVVSAPEPDLPEAPAGKRQSFNPLEGRMARIEADRRGHFLASARLNGRRMDVLVDTGATLVALNETTARKIGIRLSPSDFRQRVRTANGIAEAAAAVIDEIGIDRVIVRDVPATVLRDGALDGVLLGMSFLGKLRKFEVQSGTLVLAQ